MKVLVEKIKSYDNDFTNKNTQSATPYNDYLDKTRTLMLEFDSNRKAMSVVADKV